MWNKELSCIVPGRYTRPCDTLWSKLDTRIRKTSETARAREDNAEDNADGGENEGGLSALLAFDKRRDALHVYSLLSFDCHFWLLSLKN